MGSTATVKKTMPSPPSHWLRQRHSSVARGMASVSLITVQPVVVKADILSKKASVKLVISPLSSSGSVPTKANITHERVMVR